MNDYDIFSAIHPRVVLAPNAVEEIGSFVAEGDDILYLGRLAQHKRVDRVIRTFASFNAMHPRRILHIVGPEWDVSHDELRALAAASGVLNQVRFHGVLTDDSLRALCRRCGYFWSASEYEGFGMALVEAMSVGLLPFVQPNASFRELIETARVGRLVDFSNSPLAAQAIAAGMRQYGQTDRVTATEFARRYDWSTLARRSIDIYRECIDESSGRGRARPA